MNYNRISQEDPAPRVRAALFFDSLKDKSWDQSSVKNFLLGLRDLEADIPILKNIGALIGTDVRNAGNIANAGNAGSVPGGIITGRLESRYLRIRFVQEELGRLDFTQAKPGTAFEDFIFSRIDFSVYDKIDEKTFSLLYEKGPDDYGDLFFEKNFKRSRPETGDIIRRSYKKIGPFYYRLRGKGPFNPLLLSIMRTLQTSLEFRPLLSREEVLNECTCLIRFLRQEQAGPGKESSFYLAQSFGTLFRYIVTSLDQAVLIHDDGMETRLLAGTAPARTGSRPDAGIPMLRGVFHPQNKPYTVTLVPDFE
jgi:hypothetical protein